MKEHLIKRAYPIICALSLALGAGLFSSTGSATSPKRVPLTLAQKLEYSDIIFLGTVRKLYLTDKKNTPLDPSSAIGLAGSTAIVEVNEVILDQRKRMTPFALVPLGDPASSAKERLENMREKGLSSLGDFCIPNRKTER